MKFPDYYGVKNKPSGNKPTSRATLERQALKVIINDWSFSDMIDYMADYIDYEGAAKRYVKAQTNNELKCIIEEGY